MDKEQALTATSHLVNIYGKPPQLIQAEEQHLIHKGGCSTEYHLSVLYRLSSGKDEENARQLFTGAGGSWESALLCLLRRFNEEVPQQQEILHSY